LNTDGLPVSLFSQFSTVLGHGPGSFPTQFTQKLAEAAGWSNGYAHMGLNSLSRNYQGEVGLAEGVFKYNVCYYFGMSIDFERDNFLVRDENTLGCLLIYRKPGGALLNPPEDKIACPLIR